MTTNDTPHWLRRELRGVLVFLAVIWAVFILSFLVPSIESYGLVPRTFAGLIGIVSMPLLHHDWTHLLGNTAALVVLLVLLASSRSSPTALVVVAIWLVSGLILWVIGRSDNHIGASALVFGLIVYLIVAGFLERRLVPLLIAIVVGFLFGTTLLWGIMPRVGSSVSWEGHLSGAVAGGLVAYAIARRRIKMQATGNTGKGNTGKGRAGW